MNQLYKYTLPQGSFLYRYDILEPPTKWSVQHKNPEYIDYSIGTKNVVNAFFFFNSKRQAESTGRYAIMRNNRCNEYWISKCKTKRDILLLDLRDFNNYIALLNEFTNEGFNILTEEFSMGGYGQERYSQIAEDFCFLREIYSKGTSWVRNKQLFTQVGVVVEKIEKVIGIPKDNIGGFCQSLTDYKNGVAFKNLLCNTGFEGYIFNESDHSEGSDTICVFETEVLTMPEIDDHIVGHIGVL